MIKYRTALLLALTFFSLRSVAMTLSIESSAFSNNTNIPSVYTCSGSDASPPLRWQDTNDQTKSYVLIVDDPDAPSGTWVHWVLFNIPANVNQLSQSAQVPNGAVEGNNSWGTTGYRGPCPPSGTHRYFFKLYALDSTLNLKTGASKNDVISAMNNHVLASTELVGLYKRAQ